MTKIEPLELNSAVRNADEMSVPDHVVSLWAKSEIMSLSNGASRLMVDVSVEP